MNVFTAILGLAVLILVGATCAKLAGRNWRLMTPPQHLWFFTRASMEALAHAVEQA